MQMEIRKGSTEIGSIVSSSKRSISASEARELMGQNFFGLEDWESQFFPTIKFAEEEKEKLNYFPWSAESLESPCPFTEGKKVRETHFAFLVIDRLPSGHSLTLENLKILLRVRERLRHDLLNDYLEGNLMAHDDGSRFTFVGIRRIVKDFSAYYTDEKERLKNQSVVAPGRISDRYYSTETCRYQWYLMPLQLPDRFRILTDPLRIKQTEEDKLPEGYDTTLAVEETLKLVLHFLISGHCMTAKRRYAFTRSSVRHSSDLLDHVAVGNYRPHDGPYFFFKGMERSVSGWDAFKRADQVFPDESGVLCYMHLGKLRMPS